MESRELFLLAQLCDFHLKSCGLELPRSDIWWKFLKFHPFACTVHYLPYLGWQKNFGDERPFTCKGKYLVSFVSHLQT